MRHWTAEVELSPSLSAIGILLAFFLSAASYHWIERPARDHRTSFRRVWLPCSIAAAAVLTASAAAIAGQGLPRRLPPSVVAIARQRDAYAPLAHACTDVRFDYAMEHCRLGSAGPPRFLLWGDSRAAAVSEGVETAIGEPGLLVSNGACPPSLDWINPAFRGRENRICSDANARALGLVESSPNIELVVLNAYWPAYSTKGGAAFWSSAQELVDRMNARGKRVLVVAGEPDAGVDVPWASAIREEFGRKPLRLSCPKPQVPLNGVTLIDVSTPFCRSGPAYRLLTDSNHPSRYAGLTIIAPAVQAAVAGDH
jgi:hypothetical protein